MIAGCFLLNEAEVLAATYFDTCVIERISDIENVESGITEQVYFPIHDGSYPVLSLKEVWETYL